MTVQFAVKCRDRQNRKTAMEPILPLQDLAIALAIGLLVGTERGWHERHAGEGRRVAGIRTFGLIGLLGGLVGLIAQELNVLFAGMAFASFAALMIVGHVIASRKTEAELGLTTEVAALLTFGLGILCALGQPIVAAAVAVVVTILLGIKATLHNWLQTLSEQELHAALKFLLISVVFLPLLPNVGYGPWEALNPYIVWWMVVLVSAISFIGYFAIKFVGAERGILAMGVLGGLMSSTAVTLSFSRFAKAGNYPAALLASGIVAAASIMFPRVWIEAYAFNRELADALLIPLIAMGGTGIAGAVILWRFGSAATHVQSPQLHNPFELGPAVRFGLLLALIMLLAAGAQDQFGQKGLYIVALVSGIADVDALTLSVANMSRGGLDIDIARNAILIAALTNTFIKASLALFIGGLALGMRVYAVIAPMVLVLVSTFMF
ncbi:MAG: MgtC/SapB family protein [Halothiobacillaceae bacterium]|nr:MgtC/SapB family protein [Halothiobacillaceae bacterium]